jgi:DNA-binding NarL/FixJ family response regulator
MQDVIIHFMEEYRVLLADDHAVVRSGIRNAIEKMPSILVVGEAEDGPTLMTALELHAPDILLIDVTMPDFEPIMAIHQIRALYPDMKILVISAYDDDVYVQGLLGAGVNGYHLKDQPLHDLNLAIGRIINGERWISSPLIEKLVSNPQSQGGVPALTSRQRDILRLLHKGWHNQRIALELGLSTKTIENHLTRIYRSLNVQSRLETVNYLNQNPQVLFCEEPAKFLPQKQETIAFGDVLLVDDNPRFRYQLSRTIKTLFPQLKVQEVGSVEEAIAAVESTIFELFIVDVILGEENGIAFVKHLKKASPKSRIILISAYPDKEFHRQGLAAGATAFIDKKMLDKETIRQILEDIIHSG